MSLPHRHVFFADDVDGDEWTCACGLVARHADGDADAPLVVVGAPVGDPLAAADDVLLARALEGLEGLQEAGVSRTA